MLRILIADDECLVAAMLRRQLEALGHRVIAAVANGAEAVRVCRAERPDLVLMDFQMPVMDGVEATRALMTDSPTCIVIVTGSASVKQAAEAAGAMGFASKPIAPRQLLPLIEAALRRFEQFLSLRETIGEADAEAPAAVTRQPALGAQLLSRADDRLLA